MKTVDIKKAKSSLGDYARGVKDSPVIVTEGGKPVAALIDLSNTDMETVSLSTNPVFIAMIERSRARQKSEGGLSLEELRSRLRKNRKVAHVR